MDMNTAHQFEDLPAQIEFHEKLKEQVDIGLKKLQGALIKVADIPTPGSIQQPTEQERIDQIRDILKRGELSRISEKKTDLYTIRLFETETVFLFQLMPVGYPEGYEDSEKLKERNEAYENEKKRSSEKRFKERYSQTIQPHLYNELLQTEPIQKNEIECISSDWRLHDGYNEEDFDDNDPLNENYLNEEEVLELSQAMDLGKQKNFQKAVMISCRVLASNTFAQQQISFSKKHLPSLQMSYKMELLWTWSNSDAGPVNKICSNHRNSKVFGMGYGDREGPGRVMIWHAKNPELAERETVTKYAVTDLEFSNSQPRLLAAVTRGGAVLLLDVAAQPPLITHVNSEEQPPYAEALYSALWYTYSDGVSESERLLTVGEAGHLWMWDPITRAGNKKVAELSFVASPDPELTVHTQEMLGNYWNDDSPEDDIDADQIFLEVPYIGLNMTLGRSSLYITTDVGCIIKVDLSKPGGAWEKQKGHSLAVFGLRHSPFISSVFLTYSADGDVAVWLHGFEKALLNLRISDICLFSIDCAVWSPSHSSILASLSRERVCLWDLSRRVDAPISYITARHYTTLAFSQEGTSLLVGCKEGDVLVYRLSEMPHRPYMQKEHLKKALIKAVEGKTQLLNAVNKYLNI